MALVCAADYFRKYQKMLKNGLFKKKKLIKNRPYAKIEGFGVFSIRLDKFEIAGTSI